MSVSVSARVMPQPEPPPHPPHTLAPSQLLGPETLGFLGEATTYHCISQCLTYKLLTMILMILFVHLAFCCLP